ncbi:MAG: transposase, partial [Candidatus Omnitrophica bacterium]|nr:transposase [Candidatus Omnitrophota bacterium]
MRRPVNFSKDNLSVQWQYVNRNLQDMGLWKLIEDEVRITIKGTIELMVQEEFDMTLASSRYQRTDGRVDYRSGYYQRFIGTTHGKVEI